MMRRQQNNYDNLLNNRQWLFLLTVGFCVLLMGCLNQTDAHSLSPVLTSKENNMLVTDSWTIPKNTQVPTSIAFMEDGSLWMATWSDQLFHLSSKGTQSISIKLKAQESPAKISYVAAEQGNQLWVMLDDGIGQVGLWSANQSEINPVKLVKEARQIAWVNPLNALWYIATDLSLNSYASGKDQPVDNGKYSAIAVSKDGDLVAVRQSRTDDILISSTSQAVAWKTVFSGFQGEIVGFGPDNSLLLLEVGLSNKDKGDQFSDSNLLSIRPDGTKVIIESGQIIMAKIQGNKLATVWLKSSNEMTVKLSTIK